MTDQTSNYDKHSRHVLSKLDFYFDGAENDPLVIDSSNYLIDYQIVEETGAEDKNPLGAISANELTITLANFNNIFSPSNVESPYYKKIKTGLMIKVYIKDEEDIEWLPFGVYFVSDWTSKMGSSTAFITCYDIMQELLLSPIPDYEIKEKVTFTQYIRYILNMLGFTNIDVDETLTEIIPYGFPAADNVPTLVQTLAEGAICIIMADRVGKIVVKKLQHGTIRAKLTDTNQIKSLNSEQSIVKTYNGVHLTYVLPQLSDPKEILRVNNFTIPSGEFTHAVIKYPNNIFKVYSASLIGSKRSNLVTYSTTHFGIVVTTYSGSDEGEETSLSITGTNLDLLSQELKDNEINMLQIQNSYIQTTDYAIQYKDKLNKFVHVDIPILTAQIRGNPNLVVGDTVHVNSEKYKLDFTGIIKRATYKYAGNLTCELSLLNAEVVS